MMDVDKIFNDLESNQTQEYEAAKSQLIEYFGQNKEQWMVHHLIDYYLKTGSVRIMDVLVRTQAPHDLFILDRLSDLIRQQTYRLQALDFFSFVVRKHPTWLFKIEKHRLIKTIFHLLMTEKEIVPLMSALLCIITLLPLIPSIVPNFLGELFDVFRHLASWNCDNAARLTDEKLVHLQVGLQMLFHHLYAMYPCNFLSYLSDFWRKDKDAIFHHTIIPLLKTVRVHPLLVTASPETEVLQTRWKEVEPHDVEMECMELSLPLVYNPSVKVERKVGLFSDERMPNTSDSLLRSSRPSSTGSSGSGGNARHSSYEFRKFPRYIREPNARFDAGHTANARMGLWSPNNEINFSVPVTPTPTLMLPLTTQPGSNFNQFSLTGSSPPEAAVEATPETTPMKDIRPQRHNTISAGSGRSNPHAARAIFTSSQPSSPMRKEHYSQFNFQNVSPTTIQMDPQQQQRATNSKQDRMIQQIIEDRSRIHGNFKPIDMPGKMFVNKRDTPDIETAETLTVRHVTPVALTPMATPTPIIVPPLSTAAAAADHIVTVCDDCNETDRTMCTAGGLQIPTSRSLHLLASGIRRNRMASYCCDKSSDTNKQDLTFVSDYVRVRRTKSCSSISRQLYDYDKRDVTNETEIHEMLELSKRRMQKSGQMQLITTYANASTQTLSTAPNTYESRLISMFMCNNEKQNVAEASLLYPQESLDQFIARVLKKNCSDSNYRPDQELLQLLCLQLQYERYRREVHAERNRRLMGRNRTKHSLEMERDRLREQLKDCAAQNKELMQQMDKNVKKTQEQEQRYLHELALLNAKYEHELDQTRCLRQANENLQCRLEEEIASRKDIAYELEALRGQVFNLSKELQHAEYKAEIGMQCKDELARLEAEILVMGEIQVKCRDRLAEVDSHKARDEEMQMLQDTYNMELKDLKHTLAEKSSQLETARQKLGELHGQVQNYEKAITEQKRLLRAVKDEYEEKLKSLNTKYDIQKSIRMQMEEKIVMLLQKPSADMVAGSFTTACSPDTDKTDIASSMERNSPLSTSLASSESLSVSLRSTELRNLQQLVVEPTPSTSKAAGISVAGTNIIEGIRVPPPMLDLASSANTATAAAAINIGGVGSSANNATSNNYDVITTVTATTSTQQPHTHPHLHLQQQQLHKQHKQKR